MKHCLEAIYRHIPIYGYIWFVPLGSFRQQYGKQPKSGARIYVMLCYISRIYIYIYMVIYYSLPMLPCWQKRCSASWWITCCEKIPYMLWWGRAQGRRPMIPTWTVPMGYQWVFHGIKLDISSYWMRMEDINYIPIWFGDVQQSTNRDLYTQCRLWRLPLCDEWRDIPLFDIICPWHI